MIAGMGTDLVEIARMASALERFGARFGTRVLGPHELADWARSGHSPRFLAKRFAAKEAAAKALGTGFQKGVRWVEIEVLHDELGCPQLQLSGGAAARAAALGVAGSQISISDERQYALAFVILTRA